MKPNVTSNLEVIDQTNWQRVDVMSDADIDFSDSAEWLDVDFIAAKPRNPQKTSTNLPIAINLSPDVVKFFQATGQNWQSQIEKVLREYMALHQS